MATEQRRGARPAGPPSAPSGRGAPRQGEPPAAVEKRGPYMVKRGPSLQAKLQKHRDLAKAALRRKGMLRASPSRPDSSGKRSVKFNKGYTALSQSPDENLVSLNSDRAVFFGALFHPKMACSEDSEDSCCSWIWSSSLVWRNHLSLLCLALLVTVSLSLLEPLKEPFVYSKQILVLNPM
ncbi:protein FAM219B isoform X4 [Pipistrellus kuhlii]|uniref:protein FAM219B isoform X4 n=1 Tax=Pipistrellus kuhlii TaxID=59472 RepID=UPI00174EDEDE|nr:protein FAM219B isoform X4 [Pipistrellus kuhlii]